MGNLRIENSRLGLRKILWTWFAGKVAPTVRHRYTLASNNVPVSQHKLPLDAQVKMFGCKQRALVRPVHCETNCMQVRGVRHQLHV